MNATNFRIVTLCMATAMCSAASFAQTPDTGGGSAKTDKMFLTKASKGGYAEVQLGTLAVQKGTADEVKKFGQKMIDDHTAMNEQLKPFVQSAGLKTPKKLDPKDRDEYSKLKGLSGDRFDREYLSYMSKDHHADLKEFRKEEETTTNSALKDTVTKGEAVIQEHSTMADKLNKQMGGQDDQS